MGCLQRNESGVWSRTTAGDEGKILRRRRGGARRHKRRGTRDFYGLEERPLSQTVTQGSKCKNGDLFRRMKSKKSNGCFVISAAIQRPLGLKR